MLCLHCDKCYATTSHKNGTFWYCAHLASSCHFKCTKDNAELYSKGVKEFLATKQDRPKCCAIKSTLVTNEGSVEMPHRGRQYAKMKVVTDRKKESYGRPFFVCPIRKQNQRCNYFAWGDQTIFERPLCEHGKPSRLLTVKKEGPNKDRKFFTCDEQKENQCDFFEWFREEPEEDPLIPVFTSHEKDRKKTYNEFLRSG